MNEITVAIVDYRMGNLFSVKHACQHAGIRGIITSSREEMLAADGIILPGIGAFGDAMRNLRQLDLVGPLQEWAAQDKPLVGVCLGLQLMMSQSHEFGLHEGLGIFEGEVVRFENPTDEFVSENGPVTRALKVPQIGWSAIGAAPGRTWDDSLLSGLSQGENMYFVHSFYVKPRNQSLVLSTSCYGHIEYCSSIQQGNIFACQFHPERSGVRGLKIYANIAAMLRAYREWQ